MIGLGWLIMLRGSTPKQYILRELTYLLFSIYRPKLESIIHIRGKR